MTHKRLKILHTNFNIGWGGQSNRVFNICKGLIERGHDVTLALPEKSDLKKKAEKNGIKLYCDVKFKSGLNFSDLKDFYSLKELIEENRFDIVHTHGSKDSWTGILASRLSKVKPIVVRTRHNIFPVKTHILNRLLYKKWTDEVIVICEYLKKDFIERRVANEGHITVIHSGLEDRAHNLESGTENDIRYEFQIGEDEIIIGMCSNFVWYKGHRYLADASAEIIRRHPESRFVIVGDGKKEIKDDVVERFQKNHAFERVVMPGFYKNMPAFYKGCDIIVQPSLLEGCCNVILEAFSHSVPVVATDVGGIPDMVEDHKTGILVPLKDPKSIAHGVFELLENKKLRDEIVQNAREKFLREFTVDRMIEKTERLYYKALRIVE